MLMPSSVKGGENKPLNKIKHNLLLFAVNKLQFEAPVQKETAAHYEMVIIIFCFFTSLVTTNFGAFCNQDFVLKEVKTSQQIKKEKRKKVSI